jgi:nucleoside-diphosphate-sugar epimerase
MIGSYKHAHVEILPGNLLSWENCVQAVKNVKVIFHLAAGIDKSYAGAFMNSVVATRNLLEASRQVSRLERFVNVSSFAVYSTAKLRPGQVLDETCEVEGRPELRAEAYCYSKAKQDELVLSYGRQYNIPYVIIRPGAVFGPGKDSISGRVGITSFGPFIHLGGSNEIPLTYVDNCAEAIVLSGIKSGIEGEVFNVVDDNRPTSRSFLKMYKKNIGHFRSINVPRKVSYLLCYLWEKYSKWSGGQLPAVYNRNRWAAEWKGQRYSNRKLKSLLGWQPKVPIDQALRLYFSYIKQSRGMR